MNYNFAECKQLVGSTPRKNDGNLLPDVIPRWGPEYEIRVDFKINSWVNDWGVILSFTSYSVSLRTNNPRWLPNGTGVVSLFNNVDIER